MDDVNLELHFLDVLMFYHLARHNSRNKADLDFTDWEAYTPHPPKKHGTFTSVTFSFQIPFEMWTVPEKKGNGG